LIEALEKEGSPARRRLHKVKDCISKRDIMAMTKQVKFLIWEQTVSENEQTEENKAFNPPSNPW